MKKIFFVTIIFLLSNNLKADVPYYLDFNYILNESVAGKKAQTTLKKKLDNGVKSLNQKEKLVQENEKKLIQKKKIISAAEYKKEIENLRSSVSNLQRERSKLINSIGKQKKKS